MSAAPGASCWPVARKFGSAAAMWTSESIGSSTSWRPRSRAICERVEYVDLRYTNGFAVGWADDGKTTGLASKDELDGDSARRGQRRG